jgi:hypothetical protein
MYLHEVKNKCLELVSKIDELLNNKMKIDDDIDELIKKKEEHVKKLLDVVSSCNKMNNKLVVNGTYEAEKMALHTRAMKDVKRIFKL